MEAQQLNNLLLSFTYLLQVLWKLVKEYWVLFAFAAFMIFLKRRKQTAMSPHSGTLHFSAEPVIVKLFFRQSDTGYMQKKGNYFLHLLPCIKPIIKVSNFY